MKLESFADVAEAIAKKKRPFHLLLGNGFSMSYKPGIFSYNAQRWTPEFGQLAKVDSPNLKGVAEPWQNDASTRPS
jgi:hypothetical protein